MAVTKRRTSHARQGKRRSHLHRKPVGNVYCGRCGQPVLPHYLCWKCGWSNTQGREMVALDYQEK